MHRKYYSFFLDVSLRYGSELSDSDGGDHSTGSVAGWKWIIFITNWLVQMYTVMILENKVAFSVYVGMAKNSHLTIEIVSNILL